MTEKKDTVLQNTDHGYEETRVEEIPLSDAVGEGRKEKRSEGGGEGEEGASGR